MINANDNKIKRILEPISNNIKKAAIFGSYLKHPNIANDIDLALWIDADRFDYIKNKFKRHNDLTNMYIEPLMCKYVKLPELPNVEDENDILPIHINILPIDKKSYVNSELWIRNKNTMRFIK